MPGQKILICFYWVLWNKSFLGSQWKQFCLCAWSRNVVVLCFAAFSIIFLTKLREIEGIVLKNMSASLASKSPFVVVWCEKIGAFVSMEKLGWFEGVKGSKGVCYKAITCPNRNWVGKEPLSWRAKVNF